MLEVIFWPFLNFNNHWNGHSLWGLHSSTKIQRHRYSYTGLASIWRHPAIFWLVNQTEEQGTEPNICYKKWPCDHCSLAHCGICAISLFHRKYCIYSKQHYQKNHILKKEWPICFRVKMPTGTGLMISHHWIMALTVTSNNLTQCWPI